MWTWNYWSIGALIVILGWVFLILIPWIQGSSRPVPPLSHQAPPTPSRLQVRKRLLNRQLDQLEDRIQKLENQLKN